MNRKLIILGLLAVALTGCATEPAGAFVSTDTTTIGATFPLTGELAQYGQNYKNGVLLALEGINENETVLDVQFRDNKGNPKEAVSHVRYFTDADHPLILNSFEHLTLATRDISDSAQTPMLSFTVYKPNQTGEYLFRDYWDMGENGAKFGRAASKHAADTAVIVAQQDSSHKRFIRQFKKAYNGTVKDVQTYPYKTKDFRTIVTKIKETRADTLVLYGLPTGVGPLLRQFHEQDAAKDHLLLTEGTESFVMEGAEEVLRQTEAISYLGSELSNEQHKFIKKYEDRFNATPRPDAFYTYENTKRIADAVQNCGESTKRCVQRTLEAETGDDHIRDRDLPLVQYREGWERI